VSSRSTIWKKRRHDLGEPFRVEHRRELGRPDHVGEQHRDDLALGDGPGAVRGEWQLAGVDAEGRHRAPHVGQNRAPAGSGLLQPVAAFHHASIRTTADTPDGFSGGRIR
jgi:hypothetical protein